MWKIQARGIIFSPPDSPRLDAVWNRERYFWVLADWQRLSLILCSVFKSRAQTPPSLPLLGPACLPISHPLWLCVCMYITIIVPSNPHPDVSVLLPHYCPACSQSWHGTISYLLLLASRVSEERGSLTVFLSLSPLSSTVAPLTQSSRFTLPAFPSTALQFSLLLTLTCKVYFTSPLFVCDYLP